MLPQYQTNEAVGMLARAFAKREPFRFRERRAEELRRLCSAVAFAAKQAGHEVEEYTNKPIVIRHVFGTLVLQCDGDEPRIEDQVRPGERRVEPARFASLAIEYDPSEKQFVGTQEDTYAHPEPGTARRRRSAVSVVAEAVWKMMDEQAALRPAAAKR